MMRFWKFFLSVTAVIAILPSSALATSIVGGFVSGLDSSTSIVMEFFNESTMSVTNMTIDGSNQSGSQAFPVAWEGVASTFGPNGSAPVIDGIGTQVLTMGFAPGGFDPGEYFLLIDVNASGDWGPAYPTVAQLAGVSVGFTFTDSSTYDAVFVDDPAPGRGLMLQSASAIPAPEPSSPALFGYGALLVASAVRRRRSQS